MRGHAGLRGEAIITLLGAAMELSPVRYARTPDGAEVAWAEMGSGPALLLVPPAGAASLIESARRVGEARAWVEALAQSRRMMVCDYHGLGCSPCLLRIGRRPASCV